MFSLGRSIDLNYPSNRLLVTYVSFLAVVMSIYFGNILNGLFAAFGFFLCWALTREIDPSHDKSAFVSSIIFIVASLFIFDGIQFLVLFYLLLSMRLISKICGKVPNLSDVSFILILASYLAYSLNTPVFLLLALLMSIIAWIRYDKANIFKVSIIISILLTITFSFLTRFNVSDFALNIINEQGYLFIVGLILVIVLLTFIQIKNLDQQQYLDDDLGGKIECKWIKLATMYYSLSIVLIMLLVSVSYSTVLILISVLIGVSLYRNFGLKANIK